MKNAIFIIFLSLVQTCPIKTCPRTPLCVWVCPWVVDARACVFAIASSCLWVLYSIYSTGSVSVLLMGVENMSHCGSFSVEIHFSTFLICEKEKKTGKETHHTSAGFSLGCLMAVEEGRRIDVFQIWHAGCWAGNLLLPPHLRHLTGVIPTICKELCAFFLSLSLVPLTLLSLPSKHPGQSASLLLRSFSVSFTEFSILQALSDRLLHFCPSVSP